MIATKTFPALQPIIAVICNEELFLLGTNEVIYKITKEGKVLPTQHRSFEEIKSALKPSRVYEIVSGEAVRLDF